MCFFAYRSVSKIFSLTDLEVEKKLLTDPKSFLAYRSASKIFFNTDLEVGKNTYRSVSKIFFPYRSRGRKQTLTGLKIFLPTKSFYAKPMGLI